MDERKRVELSGMQRLFGTATTHCAEQTAVEDQNFSCTFDGTTVRTANGSAPSRLKDCGNKNIYARQDEIHAGEYNRTRSKTGKYWNLAMRKLGLGA